MEGREVPRDRNARLNRRGCFIIGALLLLAIAALAFIGFHGDPIDDLKASMPFIG